jgi:hypothetical protein
MITWHGPNWDGIIENIHALRCDGVVEVCYELAGVEVWGKNGVHYPIQNWPDEHNVFGMTDAQTELSPIVQQGGVGVINPTRMRVATRFEPQNLP